MHRYHYTECGLDNVFIVCADPVRDDEGGSVIELPAIEILHLTISAGIISHEHAMSGSELRFLRSEFGLTQAELSEIVRCDKQTIGRWERGETSIDETAEVVIRQLSIQRIESSLLHYRSEFEIEFPHILEMLRMDIEELSKRVVRTTKPQHIEISLRDGAYFLTAA